MGRDSVCREPRAHHRVIGLKPADFQAHRPPSAAVFMALHRGLRTRPVVPTPTQPEWVALHSDLSICLTSLKSNLGAVHI
jgi:hypothetical protein